MWNALASEVVPPPPRSQTHEVNSGLGPISKEETKSEDADNYVIATFEIAVNL